MTDPRAPIAAYWDAAADTFDDEPDHGLRDPATRAAWAAHLDGWLPDPPAHVLDLGCGTGSLSELLARQGHHVTGIDLAPGMITRARSKLAASGLEATFLVGDAGRPPGRPGGYDALLSRHLVWTLPDPPAALRHWVTLLRPGGTLVLVEGRWREAGDTSSMYAPEAHPLPWAGGVPARDLADALSPHVTELAVTPLSDEATLWGGPVSDERYALVARI
ncbi:class I SAM-dependent methyltransferase [Kitasatospora sp. DSM 101779]|uniref:class I SAM-dependent methyltransferase n=1 Tax=Kitasatospora sp. DSM 101779 TaxID=2853165 RepID=UPI0021DB66A9|nr:class I SAM-dependent methyltransferase [Kitasatospora sp. DSM 101779]MCU7822508.1 class I SAM-dependent methyltransferase [Kitasatospora sp. DSM 101779]